jgi:hypothetical protein
VAQAEWGTITDSGSKGSADPNILKLTDQNRVRLLEPRGRKWRQHTISGENFEGVDDNAFATIVCPRGADGSANVSCPLCMKPEKASGGQQFPVSIRYAANVWDYESNSVKVLLGGKQIFEEFAAVAKMGFDPTATDFVIFKMGENRQTSYKVVRGDTSPMPDIKPEDLHDLDKYETPHTVERIFEVLTDNGIDYDALEIPSYTISEAEAFQMPYGKHKGMTLGQMYENEPDYMEYLHGTKGSQGQYGDAVFIAMQTILEHHGKAEPIDMAPQAPPAAKVKQAATAPPQESNGNSVTLLLDPSGNQQEVPLAAKDALLAAGFTVPAPMPVPEPEAAPSRILVGPDGSENDASDLPEAAVTAMLAAGFSWKQPVEARPAPNDDDTVTVEIGGTKASMTFGQAKPLIATGAATLVQDDDPAEQQMQARETPPPLPGPDDPVKVKLNALPTPIDMPFKDARPIVENGQGEFTDDGVIAAVAADKQDDKAVAQDAAQDAERPDPSHAQAQAGDPFDKHLTEGPDGEGKFSHPALPGKTYATKGAVTQALNKAKAAGSSSAVPTSDAGGPEAAPAEGREAKLEKAKNLLTKTDLMSDFNKLVELFVEVADKRNISEFTEGDLDKLIERLENLS